MSCIAEKSIYLPSDIKIKIFKPDNKNFFFIQVLGKHATLQKKIYNLVDISINKSQIFVINQCADRAYFGLVRALLVNMIKGSTELFKKILITEGIGHKFHLEKDYLLVYPGSTRPKKIFIPKSLFVLVEGSNRLNVQGADKEIIGNFCSIVLAADPLEPYNLKGIRPMGLILKKKRGKRGK